MRSVIGVMHGDVDRTRELSMMRAARDHLSRHMANHVDAMVDRMRDIVAHDADLGIVALQLLSLEMLVEWDSATKQPRKPVSGESGQDSDTSRPEFPPSPASTP